jgi:hypothetical protein
MYPNFVNPCGSFVCKFGVHVRVKPIKVANERESKELAKHPVRSLLINKHRKDVRLQMVWEPRIAHPSGVDKVLTKSSARARRQRLWLIVLSCIAIFCMIDQQRALRPWLCRLHKYMPFSIAPYWPHKARVSFLGVRLAAFWQRGSLLFILRRHTHTFSIRNQHTSTPHHHLSALYNAMRPKRAAGSADWHKI